MTIRAAVLLGASALTLGGVLAVGVTAAGHGESQAVQRARKEAARAQKLLARGLADEAVAHAEAAVQLAPDMASFRALLGQSYLRAGRFTSAHAALADALTLDPQNGKAALNLSLAQIAEGQWDEARRTLDANTRIIAPGDRGLAVALAGDPAAGVEILGTAVRAPDADAKTRQNFALALALAGQWQMAKTMVAIDLSPLEADQRIVQWAQFAKPKSASDQIAGLLGIQPVADGGMPVALALNAPVAVAKAEAIDSFMPGPPEGQPGVEVALPAPVLPARAVELAAAPVLDAAGIAVRYAPRAEVLQAIPARLAAVPDTSVLVARAPYRAHFASPRLLPAATPAAAMPAATGTYYVQLGAFRNADNARAKWAAISRHGPTLASYMPQEMTASVRGDSFYRLSVGGFTRKEAIRLCAAWRMRGGNCFVRAGEGDRMAAWLKAGVQLAARG